MGVPRAYASLVQLLGTWSVLAGLQCRLTFRGLAPSGPSILSRVVACQTARNCGVPQLPGDALAPLFRSRPRHSNSRRFGEVLLIVVVP